MDILAVENSRKDRYKRSKISLYDESLLRELLEDITNAVIGIACNKTGNKRNRNEVKFMERLTNFQGIPLKCFECKDEDNCECWCQAYNECAKKLREYEDLEEQGLSMKLPCDRVYYIAYKGTKYATVMSKSIQDLCLYEINGIDKDGRFWSKQETAEEKLKELSNGEK